jgi:UDPglucose 6-dehydrogenase
MGFGGPCFPRDNAALSAYAKAMGYDAWLSPATQKVNQQVVNVIEEKIESHVSPGGLITLLGMAYKAGSAIIEASQSMELAERLLKTGFRLRVSDPAALGNVRRKLHDRVGYELNGFNAMKGADAVVVLAPWPQYRQLDWFKADALVSKNALLLDCWRMASDRDFSNFHYHALGKGGFSG